MGSRSLEPDKNRISSVEFHNVGLSITSRPQVGERNFGSTDLGYGLSRH
jgi:hypothetical protein